MISSDMKDVTRQSRLEIDRSALPDLFYVVVRILQEKMEGIPRKRSKRLMQLRALASSGESVFIRREAVHQIRSIELEIDRRQRAIEIEIIKMKKMQMAYRLSIRLEDLDDSAVVGPNSQAARKRKRKKNATRPLSAHKVARIPAVIIGDRIAGLEKDGHAISRLLFEHKTSGY